MTETQVSLLLGGAAIVLLILWLAVALFGRAVGVAIALFGWAAQQGFVGASIYFACWVFMFPVMIAVCLVGAVLSLFFFQGGPDGAC